MRVPLTTNLPETGRPEVLCYLQLLETSKPFLMNLARMPALQTCLLFGRSSTVPPAFAGSVRAVLTSGRTSAARVRPPTRTVDTDTATTRIVVDNWLTFQFEDANVAGQQLAIADQFRGRWKRMVNRRLRDAARVRRVTHAQSSGGKRKWP